jgi:hypothetical protein
MPLHTTLYILGLREVFIRAPSQADLTFNFQEWRDIDQAE